MVLYRSAAVTRDLTADEKALQDIMGSLVDVDNPGLGKYMKYIGIIAGGLILLWGLSAKGTLRIILGAIMLAGGILYSQGKTWNVPSDLG